MASRAHSEVSPTFIEPMLATAARELPDDDAWAIELKWDGCRAQLRVDHGRHTLRSRPGRCMTAAFGELDALAAALADHQVILDGELVCLDCDGKPDFHALRPRLTGAAGQPATFVAFDVLHLDGRATRQLPYRQRRSILEDLLERSGPGWIVPTPFAAPVADVRRVIEREQLEGLVAKRLDHPYQPGRRSTTWLKHKVRRSEAFIVSGYTPAHAHQPETIFVSRRLPDGRRRPAGSVQLGLPHDQRAALRAAILTRSRTSRRRISDVDDGIAVIVDFHGPEHRPIRDPVIRAFALINS